MFDPDGRVALITGWTTRQLIVADGARHPAGLD